MFQLDTTGHVMLKVQGLREITCQRRYGCAGFVEDSARPDLDQRGIHELNHYIETRIIYPMDPVKDPDVESFRAYRAFHTGPNTHLARVIDRIKIWEDDQQQSFFRGLHEAFGPAKFGEAGCIGVGGKIYYRDRF